MSRQRVERPWPILLPNQRPVFCGYWGRLTVMVAVEAGKWHMSISHPSRYPTWDEIADARYEFIPDEVTMAMLLPPRGQYVNRMETCFHLHEIESEPTTLLSGMTRSHEPPS